MGEARGFGESQTESTNPPGLRFLQLDNHMSELLTESQLREQDYRLYGPEEAVARATERQREEIERQLHAPWPVLYQWIGEDGLVHHGNTVGEGATQAEAERKFFRQHPHVKPLNFGLSVPERAAPTEAPRVATDKPLAPSQKPESPTRNVENQAIPASGRNFGVKSLESYL